jgi:outer membrane immunogenic protein
MKKVIVGVAVALALVTNNAAADGIDRRPFPTIAAPEPPVYIPPWSGAYLGIQLGGAWTNDVFVRDLDGFNGGGNFEVGGDSGFLGGFQVGYNKQVGKWVFGIEGEYGHLDLKQRDQFPDFVDVRLPTDSRATIEHNWFASVTGRVGYAFDKVLIYGKAGWGWVGTEVSFIDSDPTGGLLVDNTERNRVVDGAVYGGGVEFLLSRTVSLKVEYLRFDLDNRVRVSALDDFGDTFRFDHHLDAIDTVKVGLNIKLQPWFQPAW